jgi:hypothetical protein
MTDTIKQQVETVLINYPHTRNNDINLTRIIWKRYYRKYTGDALKNLHKLPTQETIKRFRALFNEQGKYLPTDMKVFEHRAKHSETIRNYIKQFKGA